MRLSRPRFTIRLMMVLVAVAALALSVGVTRRRMANLSLAYLARAREYQSKADVASLGCADNGDFYPKTGAQWPEFPVFA